MYVMIAEAVSQLIPSWFIRLNLQHRIEFLLYLMNPLSNVVICIAVVCRLNDRQEYKRIPRPLNMYDRGFVIIYQQARR